MEKRCLALTARDKQCRKSVFKDGLCDSHTRMKERNAESVRIVESDHEEVIKVKASVEAGTDVRSQARARRKARANERDELGMLPRQKLGAPKRKGYQRRWITDDPGRMTEMLDKGYTPVLENVDGDDKIRTTDQGTRISQVVGRNEDGSPQVSYLMEQEDSLYSEDQQAKEDVRSRKEAQIRRVASSDGIGRSAYDPTDGRGQFRVET